MKMKDHLKSILQKSISDQNYEWEKSWKENYCICMQENDIGENSNENGKIGFLLLEKNSNEDERLQFQYSRIFSDCWNYNYGLVFFNKIDVLLKTCFHTSGYNPIVAVCRYYPATTKIVTITSMQTVEIPIDCQTKFDSVMISHNMQITMVNNLPLHQQTMLSQQVVPIPQLSKNGLTNSTHSVMSHKNSMIPVLEQTKQKMSQQGNSSLYNIPYLYEGSFNTFRNIQNQTYLINSQNNIGQILVDGNSFTSCFSQRINEIKYCETTILNTWNNNFPMHMFHCKTDPLNHLPYYLTNPYCNFHNNIQTKEVISFPQSVNITAQHPPLKFPTLPIVNISSTYCTQNNAPSYTNLNEFDDIITDPPIQSNICSNLMKKENTIQTANDICNENNFKENKSCVPSGETHSEEIINLNNGCCENQPQQDGICREKSTTEIIDFDFNHYNENLQIQYSSSKESETEAIMDLNELVQLGSVNPENKHNQNPGVDCDEKKSEEKIDLISDKEEMLPGNELNNFLKDNPDVEMLVENCSANANEFFSCLDDETRSASEIVDLLESGSCVDVLSVEESTSEDVGNLNTNECSNTTTIAAVTINDAPPFNANTSNSFEESNENLVRGFSKRYLKRSLLSPREEGMCPVDIHLQRKSGRPCESKCCNFIENKFALGSRHKTRITFSCRNDMQNIVSIKDEYGLTRKSNSMKRKMNGIKPQNCKLYKKKKSTPHKSSIANHDKYSKNLICNKQSRKKTNIKKGTIGMPIINTDKLKEDKKFATLLAMPEVVSNKPSPRKLKRKSRPSTDSSKANEKISKIEIKSAVRNLKKFIPELTHKICAITSTPLSASSSSIISSSSTIKREMLFHGMPLIYSKNARPHNMVLTSMCKLNDPRKNEISTDRSDLMKCKWKRNKSTSSPMIVVEAQWDAEEIDQRSREHIDVVVSEEESTQLKVIIPSKYKQPSIDKQVECPTTTIKTVSQVNNPSHGANSRVSFLFLEKRNVNDSPTKSNYFTNDDVDSIPLGLSPVHYKAYDNHQMKIQKKTPRNHMIETESNCIPEPQTSPISPAKPPRPVTLTPTKKSLLKSPLTKNVCNSNNNNANNIPQKSNLANPSPSKRVLFKTKEHTKNNVKASHKNVDGNNNLKRKHNIEIPELMEVLDKACSKKSTFVCDRKACKSITPNLHALMKTIKSAPVNQDNCVPDENCLKYLLFKFGFNSVCSNMTIAEEKVKALTALLDITGHSCKLRLVIQGHKELVIQLKNLKSLSSSIRKMWYATSNKKCFIHLFVELNNMSTRATHLHRNILKIDGFQTLNFCPSLVEKISMGLNDLKSKNSSSLSQAEVLRLEYETLLLIYALKHMEMEKEGKENCKRIYEFLSNDKKIFVNQFVRSMSTHAEMVLLP